jgi:hypothetical protein
MNSEQYILNHLTTKLLRPQLIKHPLYNYDSNQKIELQWNAFRVQYSKRGWILEIIIFTS